MKPSEIISLARRQTGCTLDIVTEDEAYKFLNFVIEDFGADIRASDSGHGFDYLTVDVTAGQFQYPIDKNNSYPIDETAGEWYDKFPIGKLEKVWYRLKDGKRRDLDVRFVDKIDVNEFPNQGEPEICFITNNSLNLVPIPKEATKMQLWGYNYNWELMPDLWIITVNSNKYKRYKDGDVAGTACPFAWKHGNDIIYSYREKPTGGSTYSDYQGDTYFGNISSYEVELFDTEENIFIPKRWHYILVEGLKYWMYGNMGVNFESARSNSRNFYDSEKHKAIQNIMDRGQESDEPYYPFLNFLNY